MIVYALFLTEEAKGKQERMCAVAQNFFQEFGEDLHRQIFGTEEKNNKERISVSEPEFLIGIFKTLWQMDLLGDVQPRNLIGFMSETFDLGLAESSVRTIWYDKCGMYDQLMPVLQEFFRNLYKK